MSRIFIASSGDLSEERKDFEILLYREGFEPVLWENIDQSIGVDRFQDRINKYHLLSSDIIIFMIKSRLGKYTLEEFEESYNNLGKAFDKMYVYFFEHDKNKIDEDELFKILALQKFLKDKEEKLYRKVENFDQLKNHFHEQKKFFQKKEIQDEEPQEEQLEKKLRLLTKLPPINDNFIGREDDLKTIEQMLENDSLTYIVNGIGGVGKSELSYKYLHENKDRYNAIAFIEITQETSSIEDIFYTMFKEEFALDETTTFDDIIKRLQLLKSKNLLLIDNLENKEDFEKIKHLNTNFDILITTRLTSIDTKHQLDLKTLNDEDAKKLFLSMYDKDENIEDVLIYLDNHPLFINLTTKSLDQEYITLEELRSYIQNNTLGKIDSKDDKTFKEHLEDTFDRQFKKEKNEELKNLLQILSIFPSIEISFETLEKSIGIDGLKVKLLKLVERGWLTKKEDSYKLHQIIRTFIQDDYRLEYDDIKFVLENIGNFIDPDDSILIVSQLKHYIPILEHLQYTYQDKKDSTISKVLDSLTYLYFSISRYSESLKYQNKAYDIRNKTYGSQSEQFSKSLHLLSILYNAMGSFDKSFYYSEKALNLRKSILGVNHLDTAKSYNVLGSDYVAKKQFDEALECFHQALNTNRKLLGELHPSTAETYRLIGVLWSDREEYSKALEYLYQGLQITQECVGNSHPKIAIIYDYIGGVWREKSEYDKSIDYYERALNIEKQSLGEDHPDLAPTYNNLGLTWRKKANNNKAIYYYKKSLELTKNVLEKDHPNFAGIYNNLAFVYLTLKQCNKAKEFIEKAINNWSQKEYFVTEIFNAQELLKEINFNIKKEQKIKQKNKKGKFCKDI